MPKYLLLFRARARTADASLFDETAVRAVFRELIAAGKLLDRGDLASADQRLLIRRHLRGSAIEPVPDGRDLVHAYWVVDVATDAEAAEWARRAEFALEGDASIEVSRLADL